jgi:hypothetical protein
MKIEGIETRKVEVEVSPKDALLSLRAELCRKLDAPAAAYRPSRSPAVEHEVTYDYESGMWMKHYYSREGHESVPLKKATFSQRTALTALRTVESFFR